MSCWGRAMVIPVFRRRARTSIAQCTDYFSRVCLKLPLWQPGVKAHYSSVHQPNDSGAHMAAVDLTTHPGHLARRLQQAHYLLWNTMVSEEINSPQVAVLNALVAEPGPDQRTVGERVGLDRSTIAEVISRLGRRGLLDKVRDPQDGRRSLLRTT